MLTRSLGRGSVILLLLAVSVFLGCPTASSTDGGESYGEGPEAEAKAMATLWGGAVSLNGDTLTLTGNVRVENESAEPQASVRSAVNIAGVWHVSPAYVPRGVTLNVPIRTSLTVAQDVIFKAEGKITIDAAEDVSQAPGRLIIESGAELAVAAGGEVTIAGELGGSGQISAVASATLTVAESAKIIDTAPVIVGESGSTVAIGSQDVAKKADISGGGVTITVPADTYPVFARPAAPTVYTIRSYSETGSNAIVGLAQGNTVNTYTVAAADLRAIFNAVYTPNAPGSARDSIEGGKNTIAYTSANKAALSDKVLALFKITIGATAAGDKIELTGTDLPASRIGSETADKTRLVVIDIGIPDENNQTLPPFSIPVESGETGRGLLGNDPTTGATSYSHIRLRVNNGARLTIDANNSAFADGAGNPCPEGRFGGGCVEVMAGGRLRDGAYEGFPLGNNAVILTYPGSYLAVGPGTALEDDDSPDWWAGQLIGPATATGADAPRIRWAADTPAGSYIEVRPGKLALVGKVTVQKIVGLIYDVWLDGGAKTEVTIDAKDDNVTVGSEENTPKGLFANDLKYKFYGTQGVKIKIANGSLLSKSFVDLNATESEDDDEVEVISGPTETTGDPTVITLKSTPASNTSGVYPDGTSALITGYCDWVLPEAPVSED
jgi:hypothetical protein